jgi:hypothetical protein
MNRPPLFAFIAIGLLVLLPAGASRLLLDLAGGLLAVLLISPVLLGGLGLLGWKVLQTRMQACSACGVVGFRFNHQCSVCGTPYASKVEVDQTTSFFIPASDLTIDITAQDVDSDA